jgi:hypothetical protein
MSFWPAVLLGTIRGLTGFLPVSSGGRVHPFARSPFPLAALTAPAYSDRLLARIIHEASSASADLGGLARVRERRRTVANRITQPPPFPRVFLPSPCSPRLAPALPPRGLGVRTLRRIVEDTTRVLTPTCAHHTGHLCALPTNPHEYSGLAGVW